MEGESKRNGSKKECHILLRPKPSDDLLPARDGEQPQFCVPRQRFLERATFLFTIILILMVCISRAIGDIAKRQLLYERVREEDHLGFEDFCIYQNRINAIQRSIEVLLAIPFGMLADTKGIRPVACLSLAGLILGDVYMYTVPYFDKAFPLSAVYGAPVLSVIGGGTLVFNGLVTAVIAAATPEKSRSVVTGAYMQPSLSLSFSFSFEEKPTDIITGYRTSFFFWTQAAFTASSFITSFVNVLTIESGSNRFTFTFSTDEARRLTFVSICVQVLGFVVLFFISSYIVDSEDSMPETPTAATVVRIRQAFRKDVASLLSQRRVFAGLAGLAIYGMGQILFSRATVALVRLAIERANAREQVSDIEETNAIQLINTIERVNGTIRLVLLTAVLPAVYLLLLRWKRDAATASLAIVCGSTALLAVGALGLGLWATCKWSLDSYE